MLVRSIKSRLFPGGVRRALARWEMMLFRRLGPQELRRVISSMGIPGGAWICIHSRLSGLGYLPHGPRMVLDAVLEAVPGCTVIMPTFPFAGSALDYVQSGAVYDPENTPSASGALSEALRLYPGALRSLHPTHPCAAVGPDAPALIENSEESQTPFGPESAYGRYASSGNAWQLLIHTNHTSIVHYFQEIAEMPNLFLPGLFAAKGIDRDRRERVRHVKVHRPVLPLYVALPEYIWLPDFAIPFPASTRQELVARLGARAMAPILERQQELERAGSVRVVRCRDAEIAAVHVPPWTARVCAQMRDSFARFPERYELDFLEMAQREGKLISS